MPDPVLLSLGSVNADVQVRVDRAPGTGSTLTGSGFVRLGGGKAANRAVCAHRLGASSALLGRVGDDDLREQALAPLRRAGLNLDAVSVAPGQATGVAMIAVLPDGRKSIVMAANANGDWDAAATEAAASAIAAAPPGSVLALDCEVPAGVLARATKAARGAGLGMVMDPSPPGRAPPDAVAEMAAITPNPEEAEALTGIAVDGPDAAVQAAQRLRELGAGLACVKLADGGCVVVCGGGAWHVPPLPVQPVDSTGAGDAFAAALAVALMEHRPQAEAAMFAVASSSLAVTAYGSQPAYAERARVEAALPSLAARLRPLARA
ncbi:MAG TPA: PfkB family carbohydrate kinase [Falsiroseomonas sp.]|jgi:ribokinase|nr:PfkB family carbohydrate kinase [Falsiroseomonas sp.]